MIRLYALLIVEPLEPSFTLRPICSHFADNLTTRHNGRNNMVGVQSYVWHLALPGVTPIVLVMSHALSGSQFPHKTVFLYHIFIGQSPDSTQMSPSLLPSSIILPGQSTPFLISLGKGMVFPHILNFCSHSSLIKPFWYTRPSNIERT